MLSEGKIHSVQIIFLDSRERHEACELLEDCKESIILPLLGAAGLNVEISGLEIMNDDPGNNAFHFRAGAFLVEAYHLEY